MGRIRHMVIFNLVHDVSSQETELFMRDGKRILSRIPQVENFELCREISEKNSFDFGFSMEFADRSAYEKYNSHPSHIKFVTERWEKEVSKFLEIDFIAK